MKTLKMQVVIPPDHKLVVEVPERIRSGPAEIVFLIPGDEVQGYDSAAPAGAEQAVTSFLTESAADPRPFQQLSRTERDRRLTRAMGLGRGLLSTSEEFARQKRHEIDLEDRKLS